MCMVCVEEAASFSTLAFYICRKFDKRITYPVIAASFIVAYIVFEKVFG